MTWTPRIGNLEIPIDANDLIQNNGQFCVGTIQGWVDMTEDKYLLGSRFMANAYIIHQVPRDGPHQVGVAPRLPLTLTQKEKSKAPVGAIAGGVVGGVALLTVVGLILWRGRRRGKILHPIDTATIQPFVAPTRQQGDPFVTPPASASLWSPAAGGGTFAEQQKWSPGPAPEGKGGRAVFTTASQSVPLTPTIPLTASERLLPPPYA